MTTLVKLLYILFCLVIIVSISIYLTETNRKFPFTCRDI